MRPLFRRIGVAVPLYLAFGAVASLSVVACVVGWLAYAKLGESLEVVAEGHVPTLILAGRLSEQGAAIIASAPGLALALTSEEHARQRVGLSRRLEAMRSVTAEFEATAGASREVSGLMQALDENLRDLDRNVGERLALDRRNQASMSELRWLQADFLDEVEPLVDDARFGTQLAIDNLAAGPAAGRAVERLQAESRKSEAVLLTNADANLAIGLIARAATLQSEELLGPTVSFLQETVDGLERQVETLSEWPDTVTLRQITARLVEMASASSGVPALRERELAIQSEGRRLLAENRELVARLDEAISARVGAIESAAMASSAEARGAIEVGSRTLLAVAILSLAAAFLIGWGYVHRNLTSRILALAVSAGQIAAGNLKAPIPEGGRDEISDMARALRLFRDRAARNEAANSQAIIDNAHVGLLTTDLDGRIEFVNPLAAVLIGDGDRKTPWLADRLAPPLAARLAAFFAASRDGAATPLTLEAEGRRPDASPVPVLLHIRPYRRPRRSGFIVTVADLTERREAERILEEAVAARTADLSRTNERLEEEIARHRRTEAELRDAQDELVQAAKLAALGQLAAGVGHELNQPLAAIRFFARNGEIFLRQGKTEAAGENFGRIAGLTARMAGITNHLKRFARRPEGTVHPVCVEESVRGALALFGPRFEEEDIAIATRFPGGKLMAMGEEIRLEQVFVNLLSNAIDSVEGASKRQIEIEAAFREGEIVVEVSDTGCGIPEAERPLVFDPFHTTKQIGAGLGLGLSISYNIIRDFGGQLALVKSGETGTVFRVTLPQGGAS